VGARISTWIARHRLRADARRTALPKASARALLAATLGLLALSVAVALPGRGHVLDVPAAGAQQPKQSQPALYRVVGCRSSGTAAHREGPARREVAFGFDDGPWTETPAFVTMLERSDARATFFMIGRQIGSQDRALLLRELRDGDVLGDHTYDHPDLTRSREVRSELLRPIERIRALSGYTPCVFRPPYGDTDAAVQRTARSLGLSTVLWNVDPADYTQPGTGAIEARVLAQVRPGSIVISHDGGGPRRQTLAAYPGIIAKLRARGYRIATIPEMLGYRPLYVPCIELCDGIGRPRAALPRDAIIEHAP
jgi:peptidoglycan-N-acetylglucosamine deacetylase